MTCCRWNIYTYSMAHKLEYTVYPKKYAHGFCFAVLCCGYTLTDFPTSIRLTSLALWQSNDCPSASKATLMNMDKYFMWIHYERLHNHNKAKHNKTVCIFLGIYCMTRCWELAVLCYTERKVTDSHQGVVETLSFLEKIFMNIWRHALKSILLTSVNNIYLYALPEPDYQNFAHEKIIWARAKFCCDQISLL